MIGFSREATRQLGDDPGFVFFIVPVILGAYVGGLWGGIFTTVLCSIAVPFFLIHPLYSFEIEDLLQFIEWWGVILTGGLVSFMTEALHRSRRGADLNRRGADLALERLERFTTIAPGFFSVSRRRPDGTLCVPFTSPRYERVFGVSPATLAEDAGSLIALTHPDDVGRVQAAIEESGRTMTPWHCEFRNATKEGAWVWVEGMAEPVAEADGGILWYGILTDITERKRQELDREEVTTRLSSYVAQAPFGILVADVEGRFVDANPAVEAMLGYSREALMRMHVPDIHAREELPRIGAGLEELRRTGRTEGEYLFQCADGGRLRGMLRVVTTTEGRSLAFLQDITAQRANERALAGLVESASDGIITVDQKERITLFNPAAEAMFGYRAADLLGQPLASLLPVSDRESHRDQMRDFWGTYAADRKNRGTLAVRGLRADGAEFPIEASLSKVEVAGGQLYTAILRDVTDRVRLDTALRQSEERFARAFNASPAGMLLIRLSDDQVVEANDAYLRLSGYSRSDLIHRPARDIQLVVDPEVAIRLRQKFQEQGYVEDEPYPFRRSDGSEGLGRISAQLCEIGSEQHCLVVISDVTQHRQAENALRVSEGRFRQLTESIHEVFWLGSADKSAVYYVSPAYEKIWGRSCESLCASAAEWVESIHPEDRERIFLAAQTKQTIGDYDEEYRIVRPDGAIRWIHAQAFPVRDEQGTIIRVAGVAEDITARRQVEAQLRQAQKMESIGLLAGGIAHDFNNWLSVISVNAEMLQDVPASDPVHAEGLAEIRSAVKRASALTHQLLAFSRQAVVEPKVLDVNDIVRDTEKMLARLLGEDILLTTALRTGIGNVRVDANHSVQVLMNLAVNARDAMPQGGRLTLETSSIVLDETYTELHPRVKAGRYALLSMTDTGCGMSPAVLSRVFEPFFTTKGIGKGTGLGLAVVHGIVEQSGGHLQVYSEQNVGTTFKIYLPVVDAPALTQGEERPAADLSGTETILLVEDEEALRRIAFRVLQKRSYKVLQAQDGAAALRLLDQFQGRIDLLVTDVVMPNLGGPQLAEEVRRRFPDVKILFTSGYTDDAVMRHGILQAEVSFLPKPYTVDLLLGKVRETLGQVRITPVLQEPAAITESTLLAS